MARLTEQDERSSNPLEKATKNPPKLGGLETGALGGAGGEKLLRWRSF